MGAPSGQSGVQRTPKAGQSGGFSMPLQHLAGNALGRFLGRDCSTRSGARRQTRRKPRTRPSHFREFRRCPATSAARSGILPQLVAWRDVAIAAGPIGRIGFPPRSDRFQAGATHINTPWKMSSGSNPVITMGTRNSAASGRYSSMPVIVHTCPAARKACTRFRGRRKHGPHGRRHQHVRNQHGKIR